MAKLTFNDDNFDQEVLRSEKPVLVDFWATWCGPCRVQRPVIEEIANEIGDKAKIGELEVDTSPKMSQQYNILSIPTLIVFKGGKPMWQASGIQQKDTIVQALEKLSA